MYFLNNVLLKNLILINVVLNNVSTNKNNLFSENTTNIPTNKEINQMNEEVLNFIEASTTLKSFSKNKEFLSLKIKDNQSDIICNSCMKFISFLKSVMLKYGKPVLMKIMNEICKISYTEEECANSFNVNGIILSESIIERQINPEIYCSNTHMCSNKHFIKLTADEYATRVLSEKPKLTKNYREVNIDAPLWKVLHVTDIHIDLEYKEGSPGNCSNTVCCRGEASIGEKLINNTDSIYNSTLAGKYGYIGKCDLPLITLENFAEKVFTEIKPDFIIWTGDNVSHNYFDSSAFKISEIFKNLIKVKYNYTLPVYPTIGNHEHFYMNNYNPFNNAEKDFLNSYGELFKDWIGNEGYETFIKFGAYSKIHPGTNLRIISLNCFLCYSINLYLLRDPTDPQSQVEWLENILRESEKNGEVVYLISHVPIGSTDILSECAKRQKVLIERFSHIIRGQFYGHTHHDEIKIYTNYFDRSLVSGIGWISPSMTTYIDLVPSFRVFDIDSDSKWIRDYTQYQLNLTKANKEDNPQWEEFYTASKIFNVTYLNETEKIYEMTQKINQDQDIFESLLKLFTTNGPLMKKYLNIKIMPKYLECRFNNDVFEDYIKCLRYYSINTADYTNLANNFFSGYWFKISSD